MYQIILSALIGKITYDTIDMSCNNFTITLQIEKKFIMVVGAVATASLVYYYTS